jgi:hypothetical protein
MKNKLFISFSIYILVIPAILLYCEDVLRPYGRAGVAKLPLSFGIEAGANFNSVSNDINWIPDFIRSPQHALTSGDGISPFINIFFDIPFNHNMGIELNTGYDSKSFDNSELSVMDYDVLNERLVVSSNLTQKPAIIDGSLTIKSDVRYSYKTTISYISFAPMFYYNIFRGFRFYAGPAVQFPLGESETEKNFSVINSYFAGGSKNSTVIEKNTLMSRLGIIFGLSYDFPLTNKITLSPLVRYQWMLTKYQSDYITSDPPAGIDSDARAIMMVEPVTLNSLQAGVRLKFEL